MQPSMFNLRVPLAGDSPRAGEVFLMNTLTDAQVIVSRDVAALMDEVAARPFDDLAADDETREAIALLTEHGFLVEDRAADRAALDRFFSSVSADKSELHITVLTTLQCNFACDYCFQGDHGDYNKHAVKLSMADAARIGDWIEARLDTLQSRKLTLMFFGGEPLLNVPVMNYLAERMWLATQARGVEQVISIVTNGLLLTREIVDRLTPFGLLGVKITLDGDRDAHDRMRPLRGGQCTFDRIIRNIREIAGRTRISIGGNFDAETADTYPALLDFLREQEFADAISRVNFKPVIRAPQPAQPKGLIKLTPVDAHNKPLGGTCMSAAGSGSTGLGTSACDSCQFADEKMAFLRDETVKRGFHTSDGVHMGPCELHQRHAYTIGPEGSLFACPGFTGDSTQSIGHIDGRREPQREAAAQRFEDLAPWRKCGDCSFIPVCGGGCSVAAQAEVGDLTSPSCHKTSFEAGLVSLAQQAAAAA
jgi:uncharacterized protein